MPTVIGILIVIGSVFGGFLLHGGDIRLLIQPSEFIIIWGAALGSLVIATPVPVILMIVKNIKRVFRGNRYERRRYLETLRMFYELFQAARRDGLMKIEHDVEEPRKSPIFKRYSHFLSDRHAVHFVCDTLRMAITGGIPPFDLDQMADADIDVHDEYNRAPIHSLTTVADALPGLGIVAAVLGIVISMSSLGGPPDELGRKVAAALVGTFLGVLTCYGFVSPLAGAMSSLDQAEAGYYRVLKSGLIAFIKGHPPLMAVEFARRTIPHSERPTFSEMEKVCKASRRSA